MFASLFKSFWWMFSDFWTGQLFFFLFFHLLIWLFIHLFIMIEWVFCQVKKCVCVCVFVLEGGCFISLWSYVRCSLAITKITTKPQQYTFTWGDFGGVFLCWCCGIFRRGRGQGRYLAWLQFWFCPALCVPLSLFPFLVKYSFQAHSLSLSLSLALALSLSLFIPEY